MILRVTVRYVASRDHWVASHMVAGREVTASGVTIADARTNFIASARRVLEDAKLPVEPVVVDVELPDGE